jgi:hypothetical protein
MSLILGLAWQVAAAPAWCTGAEAELARATSTAARTTEVHIVWGGDEEEPAAQGDPPLSPAPRNVANDRTVDDAIDALLQTLPPAVAKQARGIRGHGGDLSAALLTASTAIAFSCTTGPMDDLRSEAAALLTDPRFRGVRNDEDAVDRLLDRLWRFLESFLESEGMQGFAASTRTVYLSLLVVGVVFVFARLTWQRRWRRGSKTVDASVTVEGTRVLAFWDWHAMAMAALPHEPRRAALCARAALLARVGERDGDAILPSRTGSEIVARLPTEVAGLVAGPLQRFDALFYGVVINEAEARAFLEDIERSAESLAGPSHRPLDKS